MRARQLFLITTLLLACRFNGRAETKAEPVVLDLRARRGEIRASLLHYTPLGSTSAAVMKFLSTELEHSGNAPVSIANEPIAGAEAEESHRAGTKSIRLYLGQYHEHTEVIFLSAPMMMEREVSAQWAFDAQDRLLDIFVDKHSKVY